MKRIALLGATGSIGRQAIEVIAANPGLELVAASSGSTPIEGLAPLTQTGGDPTDLLERAQPDIVLNAGDGFAGLVPTMWALEHGVTLALANKESLVAAGELAIAARKRGKGALIPVDSEHSALFQCAQLGEPEASSLDSRAEACSCGRKRTSFERVTPDEALRIRRSMGPKITVDSATLVATRASRSSRRTSSSTSSTPPHRRGDPPDLDRPRPGSLPRRRVDRAPRLPGHARADLLRAHLP